MTETPLVSISCITYNHGPYIRNTLESFLAQKTDFPYEILIHDDASTDDTREILKEYEARYPELIRPIFQVENQYSKGICNVSGAFNFPRARGRFIAMCEGDDYWTDPEKLQLQADYMRQHPDCAMTFHAARIVTESRAFMKKTIRPYRKSRLVTPEEVIDKPFNYPTASLMFRTDLAKVLPGWYHDCPIGDVPIHIFMAAHGSVYYFDRYMSAYRLGAADSWTTSMKKGDPGAVEKRYRKHLADLEAMYGAFDRDTEGRYHEAILSELRRKRFLVELNSNNFSVIREKENKRYLNELPKAQKILFELRLSHPGLYDALQKAYYRIRGIEGGPKE